MAGWMPEAIRASSRATQFPWVTNSDDSSSSRRPGGGQPVLLPRFGMDSTDPDYSPDGKHVVFVSHA
jgi:Tol biopolymer transport system component